ncbi:hypothetical protein N0V83_001142 [Neocucurbitaria cava]|uniref:Uncharacterized protein n=1 Tax=Neocucurbitaria cava TaxID=798079 RepID=A0A9W9CQZ1_9PLEO|nr:hypothetical protein N0V83_001142 [Neocucurbitaria cava]
MEDFEAYLQSATAKGANIVPGGVMAVVDKHGYNGVAKDAEPLDFEQTFFVASCTKLITTIAILQLVERGLISLDDNIDQHLPELASQPVVEQAGSGIKLKKATRSITLRQLITHSSGTTYDWIDPKLIAWRASRGEVPSIVSDCDVAKGYAYPRAYEAGESWNYSGGFDWTSLLVERLANTSFQGYVELNIARPLGIASFTWRLSQKPAVAKHLMSMSSRQEGGKFIEGPTPFWPDPAKEAGGAGMYASVPDFARVLSDLLKDTPNLLKKDTVDQMFSPQFAEGSPALKGLVDNGEMYACTLDASMDGVVPNFGLGSLLLMEDVNRKNYFKPKGTLSWTGLPNLLWSSLKNSMSFEITKARERFPALQQDQVFLDNAGGSQALGDVINSITDYLSKTNVQLGASYHTGSVSNTKYEEGYQAAARYMNAGRDEIVLGGSTTQLFMNLAGALSFKEGDEIVLSKMEHETNVKPWLFMAERLKLRVKWWYSSKEDGLKLTPENLKPLLTPKVKFVACTHVSNILGTIHDVKTIADTVHEAGALFCVDGVSYAPHRKIDVKDFGVDFYSFSWYKVYGPHVAVLYASNAAQQYVTPMSHFFNPTRTLEDKIGFASSNYECTQSIPHIVSYLDGAFDEIAKHEGNLQKILLDFLNSRPDIVIHGSTSTSSAVRVPTISFTVDGMDSRSIVQEAEKISNYGFRWGHFYSKRLCDEVLGLGPNAVTRVSMVHYNSEEEIHGLVEALKKVLG